MAGEPEKVVALNLAPYDAEHAMTAGPRARFDDVQQVTALARMMVSRWGLSDETLIEPLEAHETLDRIAIEAVLGRRPEAAAG